MDLGRRYWVAGVLVVVASLALLYSNYSTLTPPVAIDLSRQTRLVVVETEDFDSSAATITVFERSTGRMAWTKSGEAVPVMIGRNGLGWGYSYRHLAKQGEPIKQEGDGRAPAGLFLLSRPFGLVPDELPDYMQLEEGQHFCVDDVASEKYSQIVPASAVREGTSGERMWEIDLYSRGIIVDYPTDRAAKSGSCIFVHVWRTPDTPTSGCVATDEETVARLQRWVSDAPDGAVIAIVPKSARDLLGLNLPE